MRHREGNSVEAGSPQATLAVRNGARRDSRLVHSCLFQNRPALVAGDGEYETPTHFPYDVLDAMVVERGVLGGAAQQKDLPRSAAWSSDRMTSPHRTPTSPINSPTEAVLMPRAPTRMDDSRSTHLRASSYDIRASANGVFSDWERNHPVAQRANAVRRVAIDLRERNAEVYFRKEAEIAVSLSQYIAIPGVVDPWIVPFGGMQRRSASP